MRSSLLSAHGLQAKAWRTRHPEEPYPGAAGPWRPTRTTILPLRGGQRKLDACSVEGINAACEVNKICGTGGNEPVHALLATAPGIVVSSDSFILDRCERWMNAARAIIKTKVPHAHVVELAGGNPGQAEIDYGTS